MGSKQNWDGNCCREKGGEEGRRRWGKLRSWEDVKLAGEAAEVMTSRVRVLMAASVDAIAFVFLESFLSGV